MRGLPINNLALKVLSACLAVILFILVREDRIKEYDLTIPVAMVQVPGDRLVTEGPPQSVRVRLRGPWSEILRAVEQRPSPYYVDMSTRADGDLVVFDAEIIRSNLGDPRIEILAVTPPSSRVRVQAKVSVEVPVRPDIVGQPAHGFRLRRDEVKVFPPRATLVGPASSVRGIKELRTRPIDLTDLDRNLRSQVQLLVLPLPYLKAEPADVRVEIPIEEVFLSETREDVPIYARDCASMSICTLLPDTAVVRLAGPQIRMENFSEADLEDLLFVDLATLSLEPGIHHDQPVRTHAPGSLTVLPSPNRVTVQVVPKTQRPEAVTPPPPSPDVSPDVPDASGGNGPTEPREFPGSSG